MVAALASACFSIASAASLINPGPVLDLTSFGSVPNAYFGSAIALENDTAVVAALRPGGSGFVWTYQRSGSTWRLGTQLEATGVVSTLGFGSAVALSGDTIAVLSRTTTTSAVHLFYRTAGVWKLQQSITSTTWPISAVTAIALSGDTLCLGSPLAVPPKSLIISGYVDVFARKGSSWGFQKTLAPPTPQKGERFGIAMAFEGTRLMIGAPYVSVGALRYCGACYAFNLTGTGPVLAATILNPAGGSNDLFGSSVALSGKCMLVGSLGKPQLVGSPSRAYASLKGSVTAFALNAKGVWQSEGAIPPPVDDPDPLVPAAPQTFGQKIALSGCLAVVSSPTLYPNTDRSYVYQRRGAHWVQLSPLVDNQFDVSTWDPQTYSAASPPLFNVISSPGGVPAISGSRLLVGAPTETTSAGGHSGIARFYNYAGIAFAVFDGASISAPELAAGTPATLVPVLMNDIVLNRSIKRSYTIQNLGSTTLTNVTFSVDNPDVIITNPAPLTLAPMDSATVNLVITPSVDGPWEAQLKAITAVGLAGPTLTVDLQSNVTDFATPTSIVSDPMSAVLRVGGNYEITADVIGTEPMTYQWYKDGKPCKGCTSRVLSLSPVKITDKGTYELYASNEGGNAFSGAADIAVYEMQPAAIALRKKEGESIAISVPIGLAAGSKGIAVAWYRNGVLLKNDLKNFTVKGATTPSLTVTQLNGASAGLYTAVVNPGDQNVTVATWNVIVTLRPVIQGNYSKPMTMPVVSPLTMHFTTAPAAVSFVFKGLPPGVVADTKSGTLAGRPTTPGTYNFTVAGSNIAGTGPAVPVSLTVQPLDARAVGTYQGIIGRDPGNGGLGGKVTLIALANGLCSGSATAGSRTVRFVGPLQLKSDGSPYRGIFSGTLGGVTDYYTWDIDVATGKLSGQLASSNSSSSAAITGWSNPWSTAHPATAWSDYITVALNPPATVLPTQDAVPYGVSFGSAVISPAGAVAWTGRMADGSVTTGTSSLSGTQTVVGTPDHVELPLNFLLNAGKGSAQGLLWLSQSNAAQPGYHSVSNSLDWYKQPSPGRSFASGIPLQTLAAEGGRYRLPEPGYLILNLPVSIANAQLSYVGGTVESAGQYLLLSQPFTITLTGRADFAQPDYVTNRFAFSSINGLFSGSAQLADPSPSNASVLLHRSLSYYGVLVNDKGVGFFTLPELPNPTSTPPTTLSNSPIASGRVALGAAASN